MVFLHIYLYILSIFKNTCIIHWLSVSTGSVIIINTLTRHCLRTDLIQN